MAGVVEHGVAHCADVRYRPVGQQYPVAHVELFYVANGLLGGPVGRGQVRGVDALLEHLVRWRGLVGIEAVDPEHLPRPEQLAGRGVPGPTPGATQPLSLGQVGFAPPELVLRPLALDPLSDRVRDRTQSLKRVRSERTSREHRHDTDHPVFDNQRVAGEGGHPLALCPLLVTDARVTGDVVREVGASLPGDGANLQVADGYPAVRA